MLYFYLGNEISTNKGNMDAVNCMNREQVVGLLIIPKLGDTQQDD